MRFTPRFLDELRDRLRVTDYVGRKVKLVRRGRNHTGLCPFHTEKTPSFSVNEEKGFYHCFGCGEHGNVFDFVMKTEGLSFPETIERLAADAGMELPKRDARDEMREKAQRSLHEIMEMAADFFEAELKGPRGSKARSYLDGRQLTGSAVQPFRLGFSPDSRHSLKDHLASKGVTVEDMVEAGLLVAPEEGGTPYDRFRGRVMFPIIDPRGRVIAFGGRTLDPDGKPKYLNSPETPLFRKSMVLFNFGPARKAVTQGAALVAVEGYVDVIALVVSGFAGAVAPLGTALTEEHLEMMWRVVPEPILCFDGDAAGIKAAQRGIDIALPLLEPGHSLKLALLPSGQDPDDLIRSKGSAALQTVLQDSLSLSEMLWRREIESADLSTPERRAGAEAKLMGLIDGIGDPKVREHYRTMMRDRLRELFSPGKAKRDWGQPQRGAGAFRPRQFGKLFQPERPGARPVWTPPVSDALRRSAAGRGLASTDKPSGMAEEAMLLAVLRHPFLLDGFAEVLAGMTISEPKLDKLRRELLHAASLDQSLDSHGLRDHLRQRGFGDVCERLERQPMLKSMAVTRSDTPHSDVLREFQHVLSRYRKLTELESEHSLAAEAFKREATEENFARLRAIDHELKSTVGAEAGPPDAF
ncbi:MAG: DNA primase [Micropepsaceae bacterium]